MNQTFFAVIALLVAPMVFGQSSPMANRVTPASGTVRQSSLPANLTSTQVAGVYQVDPESSVDIIGQINAFIAKCGESGQPCSIHIPAGIYTASALGTVLVNRPNIEIRGEGRSSTLINYAGANFLKLDEGANFNLTPAGRIGGFTLHCQRSGVTCIKAGSVTGADFEDISIYGPGGTLSQKACNSSTGFQFQNNNFAFSWMERAVIRNIQMGGFCQSMHWMAPQARNADGSYTHGTDSFGYWSIGPIWLNIGPGSRAIDVDEGASLYHVSKFEMAYNSGGTTAADEIFHINGVFDGAGFNVTGENAGAPITFCHMPAVEAPKHDSSLFVFTGSYHIFGNQGCVNDAGSGIFYIGPYSSSGVASQSSSSGIIANFGGSRQTVNILYGDQLGGLENGNPGLSAARAWAISTSTDSKSVNPSSPFDVYDPNVPMCWGTQQGYSTGQPPSTAVPQDCLNSVGQHYRPHRTPPDTLSWEGRKAYSEKTYSEIQAPDGSYRYFGNADFVDEGQQASRIVGQLSCHSMTLPDVGHGDTEQVRICWGPDDTNSFSSKGRLYLQVNVGGSWQTSLLLTPSRAVFAQPVTAPSIAPANGFTGTKTAGNCVFTIASGVITSVTGC